MSDISDDRESSGRGTVAGQMSAAYRHLCAIDRRQIVARCGTAKPSANVGRVRMHARKLIRRVPSR